MGGSHSTTALHPLLLPSCLTYPLTGRFPALPMLSFPGCRWERGIPGLTLDLPASSLFLWLRNHFSGFS